MKNQSPRAAFTAVALIAAIFFLPACGHFGAKPAAPGGQPSSEDLLAAIRSYNRGLKTSKGIGRFSYRSARRRQSARFAWVADYPFRIRLQVFTISGQSQLILVADDRHVQFFSARENRVYRKSADDAVLEKIVDLPVTLEDMIGLLCGRIPLRPHLRTTVQPDTAGKGWVVLLKKSWGGISEKIYLDARRRVQRLEIFSFSGKPAYGVGRIESRLVKGFRTPKRFVLTGPNGRYVRLDVERFWVNPDLPPEIFTLKTP